MSFRPVPLTRLVVRASPGFGRVRKGEMRNPEGLSFWKVLDGASPTEKFSRPLSPCSVLGESAELEAVGIGTIGGGHHEPEQAKRRPADLMANGLN